MTRYRVSVDIGGTFTDLIALNEADGRLLNFKVSSTPRKPSEAVMKVFKEFLKITDPRNISTVSHATTIAVNSLLGQLGLELPRAALITTMGFRDVLAIGRQRRSELYNLFLQKPRILIPRSLRYEIDERIGPEGKVIKPLDVNAVQKIATELGRREIEAVAISLLHSYVNPKHEQQVKRLLQKTSPSILITCSSEIAPEYREFERTSTAAINACLMPIISNYLRDLDRRMLEIGISAPLTLMQSDGGVSSRNVMMERIWLAGFR